MKRFSLALFSALLLSLTAQADLPPPVISGADTADTRCSLTLSATHIDYGTLSRGQLQEASGAPQTLTPGKRQLMVSVLCPYTQTLRLTVHGEANPRGDFRYGSSAKMRVKLSSAQLDNQDVQLALSTPDGVLLKGAAGSWDVQPEQTFTPVISGQPAKGKALMLRLELEPVLTESEARISSRETSEASLNLELR